MTTSKKGVLLVNLGTPDAPTRGAVYRYLKQFLSDPRVIDNWLVRNLIVPGIILPLRSGESARNYKMLWTEEGSPLKVFGYQLRDGVQQLLGDEYEVVLAMRYQNPSIEAGIQQLLESNVSELLVVPLFPQYASATTGSIQEEVMRLLSREWIIPKVAFVDHFYEDPLMIQAFVERGRQYPLEDYDHILFSYHGLPERQIRKGDPWDYCLKEGCCNSVCAKNQRCYRAHCFATTRAIVEQLELSPDRYSVCFQSRLGRDPWLQPYTSDVIEELANEGKKNVLVFCPAFICDCVETTIEIGVEYQEEFEEYGGDHLQLVEGLNDHPVWFKAVSEMVKKSQSIS